MSKKPAKKSKAKTPDNTGVRAPRKYRANETSFKPGTEWTGNAKGRPKGARNKFQEKYINDVFAIWERPANASDDDIENMPLGMLSLLSLARGKPVEFVRTGGALITSKFGMDDETQDSFLAVIDAFSGKLPKPTYEDEDDEQH